MPATQPTTQQIDNYQTNGFVVVRGLLSDDELDRLDGPIIDAFHNHQYEDTGLSNGPYPAHGKYTLGPRTTAQDPLAFLIEQPGIIAFVESLLGAQAVLSQFIAFLRTPGSAGTRGDYRSEHATAHCDYKPFRPVGSSLNWMFAIIPLIDFDDQAGPLWASPGSHKLTQIVDGSGPVRHVQLADSSQLSPLVDARLRRGDVLFMHMFTWHGASGNHSQHDRYGIYMKYHAAYAPPACGPILYPDAAYVALSEDGKRHLPNHSDKGIGTTRLVLEHDQKFLLVAADRSKWTLPGCPAMQEHQMITWDPGNMIGSLECHMRGEYGLDLDFMTYVGDFEETNHLCRVYAHPMQHPADDSMARSAPASWFGQAQIQQMSDADELAWGYESRAVQSWLQTSLLRGAGISQARAQQQKTTGTQT